MSKLDKYRDEYRLLDFPIGTKFALKSTGKVYKVYYDINHRCGACAFIVNAPSACSNLACCFSEREDNMDVVHVEVGEYE